MSTWRLTRRTITVRVSPNEPPSPVERRNLTGLKLAAPSADAQALISEVLDVSRVSKSVRHRIERLSGDLPDLMQASAKLEARRLSIRDRARRLAEKLQRSPKDTAVVVAPRKSKDAAVAVAIRNRKDAGVAVELRNLIQERVAVDLELQRSILTEVAMMAKGAGGLRPSTWEVKLVRPGCRDLRTARGLAVLLLRSGLIAPKGYEELWQRFAPGEVDSAQDPHPVFEVARSSGHEAQGPLWIALRNMENAVLDAVLPKRRI